jgi:hypothetical protein
MSHDRSDQEQNNECKASHELDAIPSLTIMLGLRTLQCDGMIDHIDDDALRAFVAGDVEHVPADRGERCRSGVR